MPFKPFAKSGGKAATKATKPIPSGKKSSRKTSRMSRRGC